MENILLIITGICFLIYNIYVIGIFGLPESLSETSYLFKENGKSHWWFTFICFIISIGLFPIWVGISHINYQFLCFLGCAGIMFAGCTPFFREDFHKPIHYASAIIAFISSIVWLGLMGYYIYVILSFISILLLLITFGFKYYVYFAEVVIYIILFIVCLM